MYMYRVAALLGPPRSYVQVISLELGNYTINMMCCHYVNLMVWFILTNFVRSTK